MNLTQRQLSMFVTTAQHAHISRASEALCISQPALSRALQEFESQLGVTLFERTTRKLKLSVEGERFLPVAQRLLSDLKQAALDIRDQSSGMRGTVTLAVGAAFACTVLPDVMRRFAQQHPGVRVRILENNSAGITRLVERSEADLGIGSPLGNTSALWCKPLLSAPLGLLANEQHHALDDFAQTQNVATLPLFKEAGDTSIMHMLSTHGSDIVAQMERGIEVSGLALQLAFVQAGAGVVVVSALGASHAQAKGLRFVPIRPDIKREVFMVQRRDRELSPSTRAFGLAILQGLQQTQLHPDVLVTAVTAQQQPSD